MNSTRIQPQEARRVRILTMLAEGKSPKQIAIALSTSEESIFQTLCRMRKAADCQTTTELVYRNADMIRKSSRQGYGVVAA